MEAIVKTYSGKLINLADPQPEDIEFVDIAISHAREGRFSNQTRHKLSVAEHEVVGTILIAQEYKLPFLVHEGGETFWRDLPGPCKMLPELEGYKKYEKRLQEVIYFKLGIKETPEVKAAVKEMDNRLLLMEQAFLMHRPGEEGFIDYSALYKLYDERMIFDIYMNWFKRLTK